MVREHAPPLLGYLQAGVLRRGDLRAAGEGAAAHAHLAHLDVAALPARPRARTFPKCNPQCTVLREF